MDQHQSALRSFWANKPVRTTRSGHFWVTAERVTANEGVR
jgi:hypothetical protein